MGGFRAGGLTGLMNQPSAQVIDGSLKIKSGSYLSRTFGTGSDADVWTFSCWVKRATLGTTQYIFRTPSVDEGFYFNSNSDKIDIYRYSGSFTYFGTSPSVLRDCAGWQHIVYAHDSNAASGDRLRLYINGVLQKLTSLTDIGSGSNYSLNSAVAHRIGEIDGYMSQCYFVDGQALGPGYFGFTDPLIGTWRPKKFRAEGTTVNDGTVWSNAVPTADGFRPGRAAADGFDGDLTTYVALNNTTFNLDVGSWGISGTMEVYTGANMRYATDGSSASDMTADDWTTVGDAGSISTLTFTRSDSNYPYFYAIRVDGVTLIDSTTQNLAYGTNGFYLPMDGNSPIGQDKSGKGNDFTPVNFGGSNSVDKATGALPILEGAGGAVANVGVRTDANAANLVLALPLVGNKEDVVASINSAQTNVTVTNNGSVPFQTTQSNFYGGSAFFEDSSSDNLTFTNFGSRFEFTGDYTIEAWIYPTDSGAADGSIFVEHDGSSYFAFNFDPGTQFNIYNNSGSASWSPSTNLPPANKWSHIALVRSGSTQTIYVNGNSIATNTASGTHGYASPTYARIGGGASGALDSYIQDLRVYKGVAKYTSNFIPASTNPDILPDTPSGVSGSSKLTKIIDGAVAFNGSSDILDAGDSTDFQLSSNYTIEFWVYPTVANQVLVANYYYTDGAAERGWHVGFSGSPKKFNFRNAGTGAQITSSTTAIANRWYHIAVVTSSGTSQIYVN